MIRAQQPGHAVISGNKTFFVEKDGRYVPYDRARHEDRRAKVRRDDREMVL